MKPVLYKLSGIRAPLTGIGRYSLELIRSSSKQERKLLAFKQGKLLEGQHLLQELANLESVSLPTHNTDKLNSRKLRSIVGNIPFSRQFYRALDNLRFEKATASLRDRSVIYHDLNYSLNQALTSTTRSSVSTVYDLSNIVCPQTHPRHRVDYLNSYLEKLSKTDAQIITISNAVKSDLIEHYSIESDRISVTHLAADKQFRPRSEIECTEVLDAHSLYYKKYVLCVATLEPRKNLLSVINAYEGLDPHLQNEYPLAMVGPFGWKSAPLEKKLAKLNEAGVIRHLGFVSQLDLPTLYSGASAFLYPSLYEGFGLPLLEAMKSGCACITSNEGALAEISSNSAIEVNALEHDDIGHHLNRLLQDPKLNSYHVSLGLERAKSFSWRQTASKTADVYDRLSS